MEKDDLNRIRAIMSEYIMEESSIIPILQDINDKFRYLPGDILEYVSRQMDIPLSTIYRIATFYNAFSLSPRGRYEIKICMGTACYIKGAAQIMESFERELGINEGQTTDDLRFGLEAISCFGCCGSAPVVVVNDDMHGYFKTSQVPKIIQKYKKMDS
ncbi:MAG: NAD(P)H-dependent oxidoreductase subunit E [Candidatus Zixiibacteriota bacterium]